MRFAYFIRSLITRLPFWLIQLAFLIHWAQNNLNLLIARLCQQTIFPLNICWVHRKTRRWVYFRMFLSQRKINICESNQLFVINFDCSLFVNKINCLFSNILGSNLCTNSKVLQFLRMKTSKFTQTAYQTFLSLIKYVKKTTATREIRAHNLTINMFEESITNY